MSAGSLKGQILVLFAVLIWLGGCSNDDALRDMREFIQAVEQQPAPPRPTPVAVQTYQSFAYAAADLRSPFAPSTLVPDMAVPAGRKTAVKPPEHHVKQHLETFLLADLALVGILSKDRVTVALIEDGEGRVHKVQPGDYLGNQWGQVAGINDTSIVIREIVADGKGGWFEKHSRLAFDRLEQPASLE